jgi:hypothetical protein
MLLNLWRRLASAATQTRRQGAGCRSSVPPRFRPTLERLEERTLFDTKIWTGAADNDWGNAANWDSGVPGVVDTAKFNNTATRTAPVIASDTIIDKIMVESTWNGSITDHASLTIAGGLTLASGTFGGSGSILIGGSSSWTGGELEVGGSMTLTSGTFTLMNSLDAVTINGGGTLTNATALTDTGVGLKVRGGTNVNNTGTWDFQSDHDISYGIPSTGHFKNLGTLSKTLGSGTASIRIDFTNDGGSFLVTAGTFQVATSTALFRGGSFTVDTGAVMDLTGGASIRFTGSFSGSGAGTLRLNNGILHVINYMESGGATFNFAGNLFQWQGGTITIDSDAALIDTGILHFASSSAMNLNGGGTLTDAGTIVHTGIGNLSISASNTLNIMDAHVYEIQADAGITGITATIIEAGSFAKTAGTGSSFFTTKFQGVANIDVETGTFKIEASGASIVSGGNFTVAAGAILDLTGGASVSYSGTLTGSGPGTVQFNGGILHIVTTGATFSFPAGLFQWKAGILTIDPGVTLTNADTVTVANADQVVLNGNGSMINNGAWNQDGAANLFISAMNAITNNGTWNFGGDSAITGSGGTFDNAGLVQKTGGTGTSFISTKWHGAMNVDVESGKFQMAADLSSTVTNGTVTVARGAVLDLAGAGTVNYTGDFAGSGAGTVQLNGGIVKIVATSGSSGASFSFPAEMLQWRAGILTVNSDASLTIADAMTLSNPDELNLNGGGPVTINGTVIESGAGGLFISANNHVTVTAIGVWVTQSNAGIRGSSAAFVNAGLLKKSAGSGTSALNLPFSNTGTVEVDSGTLAPSNTSQVSGTPLTAGTWNVLGGATLNLNSGVNLTTNNATIILDGANPLFTNIANLSANGGALALLDGAAFTRSGSLSNTGALTIGQGAIFTVTGNYTQGTNATLEIQLGGTPDTGLYGQLNIGGTTNLDGTLALTLVNGYIPTTGDAFLIMTYGSRNGDFANPPSGFGLSYDDVNGVLTVMSQ